MDEEREGASVSPLLANVYLHYVLDLRADWRRKRHAHGDVVIVRFADDFIIGFEHKDDAVQFLAELRTDGPDRKPVATARPRDAPFPEIRFAATHPR